MTDLNYTPDDFAKNDGFTNAESAYAFYASKKLEWQPIETAPFKKSVFIYYKNENRTVIVKAFKVSKFEQESTDENRHDWCDYNENDDTYYNPEGWYESVENHDDIDCIYIHDIYRPLGWMPLPETP